MRNFNELSQLLTLDERFDYLSLSGDVGRATFGYDRLLNQSFYRSKEWRSIRNYVIVRDNGNDMGLDGYPAQGHIHIHHMNPITLEDIELESDNLINPDFLICVSQRTHNAIHYGDKTHLVRDPVVRAQGDTLLW